MAAEFEATSRLPFRPLSYENIDLAYLKELIIDYKTADVYVKDEEGNIHNLAARVMEKVLESDKFKEVMEITYTLPSGEEITQQIDEAVAMLLELIKKMSAVDNEGNLIVNVKGSDIIQDENHRFVTDVQITEITSKISIKEVTGTLTSAGWAGSSAPYTQNMTCTGATATMLRPLIDVVHSNSETAQQVTDIETAWSKIYRAVTGANVVTFYASEKPTTNINVVVQMKLTGLTPAPSDSTT